MLRVQLVHISASLEDTNCTLGSRRWRTALPTWLDYYNQTEPTSASEAKRPSTESTTVEV